MELAGLLATTRRSVGVILLSGKAGQTAFEKEELQLLRGLVDANLIGMDLVEVAPIYDVAEITSLAAAHLAMEYLCVRAAQKLKG